MIHAFLWCIALIFFVALGLGTLGLVGRMLASEGGGYALFVLAAIGAVVGMAIPWLALAFALASMVGLIRGTWGTGARMLAAARSVTPDTATPPTSNLRRLSAWLRAPVEK